MMNQNPSPLQIRPAQVADAEALAALSRQLLLFEKSLNRAMGELTAWAATPDELRKQMLRPSNQFFVAEKAGEIVGYIKVVIHGQQLTRGELGLLRWLLDRIEQIARELFTVLMRRPRPNVEAAGGYIAGAFVRQEERREKVGRMLAAAAEDWLRAQGIATSDLHVLYVNDGAKQFWEDLGYEPLTLGMRKKLGARKE